MKQVGMDQIRNVVLLSHSGAGKTSLSEAVLFDTKVVNRMGKVDEGTTTSDYDPDEIKRKISINLKLLPFEWKDTKVNLIDTPGYSDFVGEVKAAIRIAEGAVIVVCGASGVQVGTEQVWDYCSEAALPRIIFVNKIDRENADFDRTVKEIQSKFGNICVPVQLPDGTQSSFKGTVDLLSMKYHAGTAGDESEIPAALKDQAESYRARLVEGVAAVDENLIEKYLNDEEISAEELVTAMNSAIAAGKLVPILVGSALQNIGIPALLNSICSYMPSPAQREVVYLDNSGKERREKPSADGPLEALVFKTSADPYVGRLTYFRVYSGSMDSNSQIWNSSRDEAERIGQLYMMRGKNQEAVSKVVAGDIGVVAKLNVTGTGDTICTKEKPVKLAGIVLPEPVFSVAVYPKTSADVDKLSASLNRLTEEEPTVRVTREANTGETVLYGIGETQLEVAVERISRKFGVSVNLAVPKVPYKETITTPSKGEYKHKKQTGGHGQYGHVMLELEPLPRGSGVEFAERIVGGSIPKNYIPAVEKGVNEAAEEGGLAGYPIADVRITVYDGSFHPVDSSEICFKIAGSGAVKKGIADGNPVLLEPIMNMKVVVPDNFTGDIIGDLNNKRARVQGMNPQDGKNVIEVQVPLAEVLRYAIDLKSMTQGRGTYSYTFSHYEQVPAHLTQKIIADRQAEKEKAK